VPITHEQIVARADRTRRFIDLRSSDRCLNLMPFCYMHGINSGLMGPLLVGGSVICPRTIDEGTFLDCLRWLRPTWYTAGATHHLNILAWLDHLEVKHELRFARSGSAPLSARILEELERRLGVPLIESLSSTETGTITSNPATWQRKPGSVGIALDDNCAIVDERGRVLARGQVGELIVRGPGVVTGYDGDPEMTRAKFRDGWFHTGDLAELDPEGYLWLRGRIDDVINRGGEKISPQEVDAALLTHPAVERALTFALPHRTLHSEVAAAVVPRRGADVTATELRRYLSKRVSSSKIPRLILLTRELPTTPSGKPLRQGAADFFGVTTADVESTWVRVLRGVRRRAQRVLRPVPPLERSLLESWRCVLGRDDLGVDDDFFLCGGDSLSAVRLIEMVERDLHVKIPLQYLMEDGSVRCMAQRLLRAPPGMADVVGIQTTGSSRPVFAVGDRFGYVLRLLLVGRALGEDQPVYGLQPPGMNWDSASLSTVPQFAAHYIEQVRAIQPNGPYRFLGASFGGLVVYEMALQLQSVGHQVDLLALVDTYPTTCRIRDRLDRTDPLPLREQGEAASETEAAGFRVARAHMRARGGYVMERRFEGELTYFSCKWPFKKLPDRRHLWEHFATTVRIVPIPGGHGTLHMEPQFSAVCRGLREVLRRASAGSAL
jgi:thioesterase domain-containing protein